MVNEHILNLIPSSRFLAFCLLSLFSFFLFLFFSSLLSTQSTSANTSISCSLGTPSTRLFLALVESPFLFFSFFLFLHKAKKEPCFAYSWRAYSTFLSLPCPYFASPSCATTPCAVYHDNRRPLWDILFIILPLLPLSASIGFGS